VVVASKINLPFVDKWILLETAAVTDSPQPVELLHLLYLIVPDLDREVVE
jgi:hypothetical protein